MENLQLQPKAVFDYFLQVCEIPHGSKNEAQISEFLCNFGKKRVKSIEICIYK